MGAKSSSSAASAQEERSVLTNTSTGSREGHTPVSTGANVAGALQAVNSVNVPVAPAAGAAISASASARSGSSSPAPAGSGRRRRRRSLGGGGCGPGSTPKTERAPAKRPSLWRQLSQGYAELVNAIIRPPRAEYDLSDLGPVLFALGGRQFERTEVQVVNSRGLRLECSWWQPAAAHRPCQELPCVVYMHGNSSCRLEAHDLLPLVLQIGCTLFAFDFAGCGMSEGEYITLGYHEKGDAKAVIDYLRASGSVSTLALWGRSMGAATALLHGHRDPSIAAMVLDSPFSSLERLAREIIDQVQLRHKPEFLIRAFMRMMRSTILKRSGLDILKLRPIEDVNTCFIPALFVAGSGDQFIPPSHAQDICEQYAGDKNLVLVDGNHNSRRPAYFMDSAAIFFLSRLCAPAGLTDESLGLRLDVPGERTEAPVQGVAGVVQRANSASSNRTGHAAGTSEQQELQEALLSSLTSAEAAQQLEASSAPGASAAVRGGNAIDQLVGHATSRTQITMPDRRAAASALHFS